MTVEDLIALRKSLGLTQAEMAARMGLGLRAYHAVESRTSKLRTLHINAAERIALAVAVERTNPMLAPTSVRAQALDLARMLRGE